MDLLVRGRVYEARFHPKSSSDEGARADRQGETSSGEAADDAASEGAAVTLGSRGIVGSGPPPPLMFPSDSSLYCVC